MADPDETVDAPQIMSSSIRVGTGDPTLGDTFRPTAIRHEVDEISADGERLQRYNFLEYEFERDSKFCRARSYVDDIREVAFFGPFAGKYDLTPVAADDLRNDVLDYLKRRFARITELNENGYATICSLPK